VSSESTPTVPELLDRWDSEGLTALLTAGDSEQKPAAVSALRVLNEIDRSPVATFDVAAKGIVHLSLALVDPKRGGLLLDLRLDPWDRVLAHEILFQSVAQRRRFVGIVAKEFGDKNVPGAWVCARAAWATHGDLAQTGSRNVELGAVAALLGPRPAIRPGSFLTEESVGSSGSGAIDGVLAAASVGFLPPLFELSGLMSRWASLKSPGATGRVSGGYESDLAAAAQGDEATREALRGPLANALDDAAVGLWLDRKEALALQLGAFATELRTSLAPERVHGVASLLQYQIASMLMLRRLHERTIAQ